MKQNKKFEGHSHPPLSHTHEHAHITHYTPKGKASKVEHLVSLHQHAHNHAALEHAHVPHKNLEREHEWEAHIHDHGHPDES